MKKNLMLGTMVLMLFSAGCISYEKSGNNKSIYVVSMTADEMSEALTNGSIAGFISWEPFPSKAVSQGYGRYLVHSKDSWENHPSCVIAISEDLKDEDVIRALVWAEVKGTRFLNDPANRERAIKYGQELTGLDRMTVLSAINNTVYIEYSDLIETKRAIEITSEAGVLKNNVSSMGYKDVDDFLSKVYINKYYNDVNKKLDEDPDWVSPRVNGSLRFGYIDGSTHYLSLYIAQKEGYFEQVGLVPGKNMQFTGYRSGRAITDALKHQEIDAAMVGTTVLLRYKINDNGRIYIVNGVNSGGASLVVGKDSKINSIEDLNGKRIATPGFGTCQDTILRELFKGYEIKTQ